MSSPWTMSYPTEWPREALQDDEKNARLDFLARLTACTKADVAFILNISTKSPQITSNID